MGGSRSSSSSSQNVQTNTLQADAQGNLAPVYQAETITQEFSPQVAEQFENLVDLASESNQAIKNTFDKLLTLTGQSLLNVGETNELALAAVAERREAQENPSTIAVNKILPFALLGTVGLAALMVFRR